MNLLIRSQDRKKLIKINNIEYGEWNKEHRIYINGFLCGKYKSEERALEVLDEIQNKLKGSFMLKAKNDVPNNVFIPAKKYFEAENDIKIIIGDNNFDITPLNINCDVYEMPQN